MNICKNHFWLWLLFFTHIAYEPFYGIFLETKLQCMFEVEDGGRHVNARPIHHDFIRCEQGRRKLKRLSEF